MHFPGHANQRKLSAVASPAAVLSIALAMFAPSLSAMPLIGLCQLAQATPAGVPSTTPGISLAADLAPAFGLKFDPVLNLDVSTADETPIYMFGRRIAGQTEDWVESEGDAEFRKLGLFIKAHQIRHDLVRDELTAAGQIRLFRAGELYEGARLRFKPGTSQGRFDEVRYQFAATGGHGTASHAEFIDAMEAKLVQATYTTCARDQPTWELHMDEMVVDQIRGIGAGKSARLRWGDAVTLPLGNIDFPVGDQRKTGFLPPYYSASTKFGFEVQVPFYWNIAPQHDLTLYPRLITRRGVQLGSEFRFLREDAIGTLKYEVLPSDRVADKMRQFSSVTAAYRPLPEVTMGINIQRASDDNYFADFGRSLLAASQRLLPGQLTLASAIDGWNINAEAQRYQLLQDRALPLIAPYAVEPKLAVSKSHRAALGRDEWPIDWSLRAEIASFRHPTLENGERFVAVGSAAWKQVVNGFSLTPKVTLHATQYWQSAPGDDNATLAKYLRSARGTIYENNAGTSVDGYTRVLPTFSLDMSTLLERTTSFNGRQFEQTLEPRLLYVHTPYKDQSKYPVFDTGFPNLNYAQMFSDVAFNGPDRVADLDQLTAGVTMRFNDADSGAERFRAGVAQRFYFSDQRVVLPGSVARTDRNSDFLSHVVVRPTKDLSLDGQIRYTPATGNWQNITLVGRYTPRPASAVSLAYRYVRDSSHTVDVAFQWPISQYWYAVGRYQHALEDFRDAQATTTPLQGSNLVEALAGFEYNGGCWVGRFVVQQYAVSATQKNTTFFFQIELNGLGRVGTNPLSALTRNIPNYQLINQVTPMPSKFDNFQ